MYNQNSINTQSNNFVVYAEILALQKCQRPGYVQWRTMGFSIGGELIVLHYVGGGGRRTLLAWSAKALALI